MAKLTDYSAAGWYRAELMGYHLATCEFFAELNEGVRRGEMTAEAAAALWWEAIGGKLAVEEPGWNPAGIRVKGVG